MKHESFANLANCKEPRSSENNKRIITKALDTLAESLGIEFGSLTIHFHKGKWSPRIEIKKTVVQDVE